MNQKRPVSLTTQQLELAAQRAADPRQAELLMQATRSTELCILTRTLAPPGDFPALARLQAAALQAAQANPTRREFVLRHEGHRYRVSFVAAKGLLDVSTLSRLPLLTGLQRP